MNPLLRGMAHHSFGDSFAPRVNGAAGRMYPIGSGHGPHSIVGKDPDKVSHEKAGKNYVLYIKALQRLACTWTVNQPVIPIQSLLQMPNPMLHPSCRVEVEDSAASQESRIQSTMKQEFEAISNGSVWRR